MQTIGCIGDLRAAEAMYKAAANFAPSKPIESEYENARKRIIQKVYTDGRSYDHGSWYISSTTPKQQFERLIGQSAVFNRDSGVVRSAHVYELVLNAWKVR